MVIICVRAYRHAPGHSRWRVIDANAGVEYNIRSAFDPDQGGRHGRWIDMTAESGIALG